MLGLSLKRSEDQTLDRRRAFFERRMLDGILASLPVAIDTDADWRRFYNKWGQFEDGGDRPFPSSQEILDRVQIGLAERGRVDDDWLPVVYSTLDAGESMVAGMLGRPMRFMHRHRGAAYSMADPIIGDYSELDSLSLDFDSPWARKFLSIPGHFLEHAAGRFAQHSFISIDALNFVVELRGSGNAYEDIYLCPEQMRAAMELGLAFNIKVQESLLASMPRYREGCFAMIGDWAPAGPGQRVVTLGVDAYVICSVRNYVEHGFEYNRRLIEHFGAGIMHFHCNRTDLAAEVARLPGLIMFQFGGDTRDPVPEVDRLPQMRAAVGDIPLQISVPLDVFRHRLAERTLMPNVWYRVSGGNPGFDSPDVSAGLSIDEANRLAEQVRAYRA